jgi:hypothetical protein
MIQYVSYYPDTKTEILGGFIGDRVGWGDLFNTLDVVGMDIYSNEPYEIAFYYFSIEQEC